MVQHAISKINYGIYVVSSMDGEKLNGQIVNTVFQVSSEPQTVAVCINKKNLTYEYIKKSGLFSVTVLEKDTPMTFIGKFGFKSGRDFNKFEGTKYRTSGIGLPVVTEYAIGCLECRVLSETDAGTHVIFVGLVTADEMVFEEKEPLTYEYYRQVKKGKSPASAPTYVKENNIGSGTGFSGRFKCTVCGYIYDPAKGDSERGVKVGIPFESLPGDWRCPVCKVGKSEFVKEL